MRNLSLVDRSMTPASRGTRHVKRGGVLRGAGLLAGFGALSLGLLPAIAASVAIPSDRDTIQTVADIVLVETQCRQFNVDYAKLFAFAERNGVHVVDLLPTGVRRSAFDSAYQRRARQMTPQQLCTDLAADRDATIPGVLTQR